MFNTHCYVHVVLNVGQTIKCIHSVGKSLNMHIQSLSSRCIDSMA